MKEINWIQFCIEIKQVLMDGMFDVGKKCIKN